MSSAPVSQKRHKSALQACTYTNSTKRIILNTLILYFRQILIMLVSLYTVRVVLNTLGAEDYGIYNVVAGVVTLFGFLSGAMALASQRYFSFEMGRFDISNEEKSVGLKKIFGVTLTIYILLAFVIVLLAETIGLLFVWNKLVIPAESMAAAQRVYQFSILSFTVTLLTTPYMSLLIAHENMNVYAYMSIAEVLLKLGTVFLLTVLPYDKLSVYGFLLFVVAFINTMLYRGYCRIKYQECRFHLVWDTLMFKEMSSYIGWNLFGAGVGVVKNQGINILLNQSFGPIVNAARSIAAQVNTAVASFAQNFSTAVRPQIIKSYAAEKSSAALELVFYSCKTTFFLMYIFSLPLLLEMPFILKLWLKFPPEAAVLFTRLALIDALIDSISYPIMTLAQATGRIKAYQGIVGSILLCNLPVSWLVLRFGAPAWSVMVIAIIITAVAFIVRLFVVKRLVAFSIVTFAKRVGLPVLLPTLLSASCLFFFKRLVQNTVFYSILIIFLSVFCTLFFIFLFGLSKNERKQILFLIKGKLRKDE